MAQPMTPEDALQAIAGIRRQREHLTLRAAGLIWMVWALVVGLIGAVSQASYHAAYAGGWVDPVSIVAGGSIGALVTNAIWRAHALEHDPRYKGWVAWMLGVGGILALGLLVVWSNQVDLGFPETPLMLAPVALLGAYTAAAAALAMRRHVPAWPGLVASSLLLGVFAAARFLDWAQTPAVDFLGNLALTGCNVLVFTLVGLYQFNRG